MIRFDSFGNYDVDTGIIYRLDGLRIVTKWTDSGQGGSMGVFLLDARADIAIQHHANEEGLADGAGFLGLPAVGFRQVTNMIPNTEHESLTRPASLDSAEAPGRFEHDWPYIAWSSSATVDGELLFGQNIAWPDSSNVYDWQISFELVSGAVYSARAVRHEEYWAQAAGQLTVPGSTEHGWRLGFGADDSDVNTFHRVDAVQVDYGNSDWRELGGWFR
jgi:hypothetical protein